MRLVDTHCHLYDTRAFPSPEHTVAEAVEAGVARLIVVGIDEDTSLQAIELADRFSEVFAIVGWHPTSAGQYTKDRLKNIGQMLSHNKVVAIGEVGLDFYWDKSTPEEQYRCLTDHLDLAAETDTPVAFHCRDANDELLTFLESRPVQPYLFHCFSGDENHAKRALALGAYLGVDGPITYPKSDALRDLFASVPKDRIVIETDSPYMAPVPYRGQKNRPAWVKYVNEALARTLGLSQEECAETTTKNAETFFRL